MKTIYYTLISVALVSCSLTPKTAKDALDLPFSVNGKPEAMPAFQRGLRLLHNFEYEDAAEAFIEAQNIDPDFTMAYWGEAMTYNHTVWGSLDIDKAREALGKLGETQFERVAKGKSKLEKDFITAIEILYGEETKPLREQAYAEFMAGMYDRYDAEPEVSAFYALALLGAKESWTQMEEHNFTAAGIAEEILKGNPTHPGALHYLIHANDHPEYANYSLTAARDYALVASYAGHALHMPSHIYLALGMWSDVVKSNEVSWQASVDRKTSRGLSNDELDYHSHWWLLYGYLQQGRYADAERVFKKQISLTEELPSPLARYHLLMMKGHYLIETGNWNNDLADLDIKVDDMLLGIRSVDALTKGIRAFHLNAHDKLLEHIRDLEQDLARGQQRRIEEEDIAICGVAAVVDKMPSKGELNNVAVLLLELKALEAWLRNDLLTAELLFNEANEKAQGYLIGPPKIIKPVQELYGEFLLATKRPARAAEMFKASENASPNRLLTLKGHMEALKQLGDEEGIKLLKERLTEAYNTADAKTI